MKDAQGNYIINLQNHDEMVVIGHVLLKIKKIHIIMIHSVLLCLKINMIYLETNQKIFIIIHRTIKISIQQVVVNGVLPFYIL